MTDLANAALLIATALLAILIGWWPTLANQPLTRTAATRHTRQIAARRPARTGGRTNQHGALQRSGRHRAVTP